MYDPKARPRLRVIDPRQAGDEEVVGIGDDLAPETLRWAYRHGIFPWPIDSMPLLWFCPPKRAVLEFDTLHVPRRLARLRRHCPYTFTLDTAFDRVLDACRAAPRPGQGGTWITPALQKAFAQFHRTGDAHSVEAWDAQGALVGGLYGVASGGAFGGESMFHAAPNASKLALLFLIDHLSAQGVGWMDIQMMTPHMEALGAAHLTRDVFLDKLEAARARPPLRFGARPDV